MATIRGTAGNDNLVGTSLSDAIYGGTGDDRIFGGAGNDKMAGGSGADTFVFVTPSYYGGPNGADVITDFQVGEDVLHFDTPGWGVANPRDLAFSQVGNDTVISYGSAGDSITLLGVDLGQLMSHASTDFWFS